MYKYKVILPNPNKTIIEFESKYRISILQPRVVAEGAYPIVFEDAEIMLNLAAIREVEINGEIYYVHLDGELLS